MKKFRLFTISAVLLLAALSATVVVSGLFPKVSALSGSQFNPGRIIDDSIFYNSGSMSVSQIQTFLNSKVPTCDTNGTVSLTYYYNSSTGQTSFSYFSGGTATTTSRATFGQRFAAWYNAHPYSGYITNESLTPYTCLKGYTQSTPAENAISGICGYLPSVSSDSAADIIARVSTACGVSPKVLIVLLQKEQGLVTDDWPWAYEYRTATGYGCPDTSACDSTYYGFFNQVYNAAKQYKLYRANPTNFNYVAGQNNSILYNPNSACGSETVYIQNQATAGLYDYTPYVPNQAALNNLYGSGDSCSSYGNRDFWRYYNDWFGNSVGPGYSLVSTVSPAATIAPNEVISGVQVTLQNESGETWYSDGNVPSGGHPTRLAMQGYHDNPYANTSDPAWLGTRNQIKMDQASVPNGSNASFTFSLRAPIQQINKYVMNFVPVLDGVGFYQNIGMQWILSTPAPNLSYQVTASTPLPQSLPSGTLQPVSFTIKNTGNVMWYGDTTGTPIGSHPIRLYTVGPAYHSSPYYDSSSWIANNQIVLNTKQVNPGDSATFSFNAKVPAGVGKITDSLGLIVDGVSPYPQLAPVQLSTTVNDYEYQVVSSTLPTTLTGGQDYTAKIILKNTGSKTWYSDGNVPTGGHALRLATPGYSNSPLAVSSDPSWMGTTNQVKMVTASVAPGATGEFDVRLVAPYTPAAYHLSLLPVLDGQFFLGGSVDTNISVPALSGGYVTLPSSGPPGTMSAEQTSSVQLIIKNDTNDTWYADGSAPNNLRGGGLRIVMYAPWYRSSAFADTSDANWLGTTSQVRMTTPVVKPGDTGTFNFTWKAPATPGTYTEKFGLAIDGYTLLPYVGMQFVTTVQ